MHPSAALLKNGLILNILTYLSTYHSAQSDDATTGAMFIERWLILEIPILLESSVVSAGLIMFTCIIYSHVV